jgi:oxygen-independent coproporphyrinogen III oxidase
MAGIYIHIPFCKQKCTYCDFHFSTSFEHYRKEMIETIGKEIALRKEELKHVTIASIYFGGGTPSILNTQELNFLLQKIHANFDVDSSAEITLEANPDDISAQQLAMWKDGGINRLSIGLQSFKSSDLNWMNRAHTVEEALSCVQLAKKSGFNAISVDLIYGLPDLTMEEWKHHIDEVIAMDVQHISAYCLTVEEKTALNKLVNEKKIVPAGEDAQSEQFLELSHRLKKAGFLHYEISNFGKPGFEAVHNSNYWKGVSYMGVGPSAHSFNGSKRRWNISNNSKYLKQFASNAYFEEELLTLKDQWNEIVMTGLRTTSGVAIEQLTALFPLDEAFQLALLSFQKDGMIEFLNNHLSLTDKGRLQADFIASEFFKV